MKNVISFCAAACLTMLLSLSFSLKAQNPCEPLNQTATEITAHTAVLSWEGLTGFTKVRYYPTGTTNYKFRGAHLNNTVTLGLLLSNTAYTWEISTYCDSVWTEFGWPQTFTTLEDNVVCEPINQEATEITAHTAVLSWEGLTGYTKVRYYPTGTTNYKIRGAQLYNTVTLGYLLAETEYTWEISTFCNGIWTEYGWPQTFTTLEDNVVCEPLNQEATEITAHTAVLSWEGLTGYTKVRYYPTGTTNYKIRGAQLYNTVTLGYLLAETEYTWEISTFCNGIWTEYGWPQTFTTLEDNVVCEPTNQQSTDITEFSAVLSWENLTGYTKVRYYPTSSTNYKIKSALLNNTVTLYYLLPNTEYTWEISTFCNGIWTEYGWAQTFTTLESSQVCEPINQTATDITATGAVLSWEGLSVPSRVRFYPTGTANYKIKGAFLNNTITLTCLLPNTEYTWELSAYCNGAWTEFSWPEYFTTLPETNLNGKELLTKTSALEHESSVFVESTAFPNPFNDQTTLNFNLSEGASYSLKVINMLGEVVYEFQGNASEGLQSIVLNLSNENSGIYFAILQTGELVKKTKLIKK